MFNYVFERISLQKVESYKGTINKFVFMGTELGRQKGRLLRSLGLPEACALLINPETKYVNIPGLEKR